MKLSIETDCYCKQIREVSILDLNFRVFSLQKYMHSWFFEGMWAQNKNTFVHVSICACENSLGIHPVVTMIRLSAESSGVNCSLV